MLAVALHFPADENVHIITLVQLAKSHTIKLTFYECIVSKMSSFPLNFFLILSNFVKPSSKC